MIVVLCNLALAASSEDFKGILKDLDSDGDGKLSSSELEERLNALALATIAKNATAPPGTLVRNPPDEVDFLDADNDRNELVSMDELIVEIEDDEGLNFNPEEFPVFTPAENAKLKARIETARLRFKASDLDNDGA